MISGRTLVNRFFASETIGFLFGVPVATAYALLLVRFDPVVVSGILRAVLTATVVIVVGAALPTNLILCKGLADRIDRYREGSLPDREAVRLFYRLVRLPFLHGLWIFGRISAGALAVTLHAVISFDIESSQAVSIFCLALYGAYISGLIAYVFVAGLVRGAGEAIVAAGLIDPSVLRKKRFFGLSFSKKAIIFLIIPALYANLSVYLYFNGIPSEGMAPATLKQGLAGVLTVNLVTMFAAIVLIIHSTQRKIRVLESSLGVFVSDSGDLTRTIPTSLTDEFEHISHLINQAMGNFRLLLEKIQTTSGTLFDSTVGLSTYAQQIHATSNDQAASVKEMVTAMEDSDRLSKQISGHIREVAEISGQTRSDAERGGAIIRDNRAKMAEIKRTNAATIDGIKTLNDQIKNIWEIVTIINTIANQTKIIAFNAELEASSAGAEGKNFEIVAGEVRRLADNTVESTEEIKGIIHQIQGASDHLILSSEQETNRIQEGWKLSQGLDALFQGILASSEESASSAARISSTIDRQVSAFEGILGTLKHVSGRIESFVESTSATNLAAESLNELAEDLNAIVERYVV